MKTIIFSLFFMMVVAGCNGCKTNDKHQRSNKIISKVYHKTGTNDTDTLWVSQNDTLAFKAEEGLQRNPGQKPELVTYYELKSPKDGAYYFIYNDAQQLIQEGKYTAQYVYDGKTINEGNFYNSKRYSYKDNGKLSAIYYQVDGRNFKTELYNRNRELKEIIYFNKKSGDKEKVEIYKNGKLKETRIYTSFDVYHTIKSGA